MVHVGIGVCPFLGYGFSSNPEIYRRLAMENPFGESQNLSVNSEILGAINQMFPEPKPGRRTDTIVSLNPDVEFEVLAKAYLTAVHEALGERVRFHEDILNVENFVRYFKTLLYFRVLVVNGESFPKQFEWFRRHRKTTVIPTVVALLLQAVGIAEDTDYGVRFIPQYNPDPSTLADEELYTKMSNLFFLTMHSGLTAVLGMLTDPYGDVLFMAAEVVEGWVLSHLKGSPYVGLFVALLRNAQVGKLWGGSPRIVYGPVDLYTAGLTQLVLLTLHKS